MLREEAMWLGREMEKAPLEALGPVLDVGSSTQAFRERYQPWVGEFIYGPLERRSVVVRHVDIRPAPGVDIVGDLTDPEFVRDLTRESFGSVLCSNLLEHVETPDRIAQALAEVLPSGGRLFVSCPFRFPYHPDPIDTRFRPDLSDLAALFPSTEIVAAEVVSCGTYLNHLYPMLPRWRALVKHGLRLCLPFHAPRVWALKVRHLPWLFRNLEATCLVLRKK